MQTNVLFMLCNHRFSTKNTYKCQFLTHKGYNKQVPPGIMVKFNLALLNFHVIFFQNFGPGTLLFIKSNYWMPNLEKNLKPYSLKGFKPEFTLIKSFSQPKWSRMVHIKGLSIKCDSTFIILNIKLELYYIILYSHWLAVHARLSRENCSTTVEQPYVWSLPNNV